MGNQHGGVSILAFLLINDLPSQHNVRGLWKQRLGPLTVQHHAAADRRETAVAEQ